MPDHVLKLVRNTAGRDALTMIYAAALVKEPAIADGLRHSAKALIEISDDAALAHEYASSRKDAVSSLMMLQTLRTAHAGSAEGLMGMIVDGPRRAAQVLGHLRILDEQFPAASLFADTPLAPGQRCVLIAAGVAVSYAQSSVPGRLDPIGGGEPVLVGQNSDGSVRVTDADGGNPRVGALRVFAHAPAPAPVPEVKDHGPSEMTGP